METIGDARRRPPSEPRNGAAPKANTPPSSATSQYPDPFGSPVIPTTGRAGFDPASEPKNGAAPLVNTPPSSDTNQEALLPSAPARAMATGGRAKGFDPSGPWLGADPKALTLLALAVCAAAEAVDGPPGVTRPPSSNALSATTVAKM